MTDHTRTPLEQAADVARARGFASPWVANQYRPLPPASDPPTRDELDILIEEWARWVDTASGYHPGSDTAMTARAARAELDAAFDSLYRHLAT